MKIVIITILIILAAALTAAALILIRRIVYHMIDRRIERFQSDLIEKQIIEIRNMYKQVRGWRHDYRNHIQNMKIQLLSGNYKELEKYLDSLAEDLNTVDTVIKTGNVMADAILNSKLSVAEKLNISINCKANIPVNLPMSDVELCAVLGNMLDNAAEACEKLPEEKRFIRIYIGSLKDQFYLSITNSAGEVRKSSGAYLSTKANGELHGYGIFRVDRVAKKYGGYVNRQNEPGVFATEIMIPLNGKIR